MNGFDKEKWKCGPGWPNRCPEASTRRTATFRSRKCGRTSSMAKRYVLADEMFASNFDSESFISHQYIIAGINPDSTVGSPDGDWGCPGGPGDKSRLLAGPENKRQADGQPCWNLTTLGDELDAENFVGFLRSDGRSGGEAPERVRPAPTVRHGYGQRDLERLPGHQAHLLRSRLEERRDIAAAAVHHRRQERQSSLGNVGDADLRKLRPRRQRLGHRAVLGYLARQRRRRVELLEIERHLHLLGRLRRLVRPGRPKAYLDNDGLGFRLPMLIISPYARQNFVSHIHYEHGSILKFVEDQFGLPAHGAQRHSGKLPRRPNAFDFEQQPREFVPFNAPYDTDYFMHQPLDGRAPDSD